MNELSVKDRYIELDQMTNFALDMGVFLLSSGAHCGRISRNIERIMDTWQVKVNINFTFTGILITARCRNNEVISTTSYKRSPPHSVNYNAINEVSQLSWLVETKKIGVEDANEILQHIKEEVPYSKKALLLGIGMSCACLCLVAGGDWRDASFGFIGAICGMTARQVILKKKFNPMISFVVAAFITTFITCLNMVHLLEPVWGLSAAPERAVATAVLYLVPGVLLTNCIIDLMEGHISTAIARGVFGAFILLCIAVGMSLSILIFGVDKF